MKFFVVLAWRFVMNGFDFAAVGAAGVLGAMTASALNGTQGFKIFGFTTPEPTVQNLMLAVLAIAVLSAAKGAFAIGLARFTSVFLGSVEIRNSVKVARYLFSGSLGRLKAYSRGQIQFVINTSTNATFSGMLGAIMSLAVELTLLLGILTIFFLVDPLTAVGVLSYFAILMFALQRLTSKRYLESGANIQGSAVDSGNAVLELVDTFREVAVLSRQDFFLSRFGEAKKLAVRTNVTLQFLKALPRYIAEVGITFGVVGFLAWQLSRGSLADALVAVGVFSAGSFRMLGTLLPLQQLWNDLRISQEWVIMAQDILMKLKDQPELLDSNPFSRSGIVASKNQHSVEGFALGIDCDHLTFTYPESSHPVLDDVSFSVTPGSFTAIIGPSGAGKTTLVDLVLGLHEPGSGTISVGGEDPRALRELGRGEISYVPQKPGMVSGSIAQNVALGIPDDLIDQDYVEICLREAELWDFVENSPSGIHSDLGAQTDSLSGGQAQRLGLARALYSRPRLIVLDEATSALDAATEASIAESILKRKGETTILVIAHRLSTVQHADAVHVMQSGKIVASGTFPEVRQAVPLVEEYVKLMSFEE
jgi:ABC-type multidrug transport system fused ATPase/permease subunit